MSFCFLTDKPILYPKPLEWAFRKKGKLKSHLAQNSQCFHLAKIKATSLCQRFQEPELALGYFSDFISYFSCLSPTPFLLFPLNIPSMLPPAILYTCCSFLLAYSSSKQSLSSSFNSKFYSLVILSWRIFLSTLSTITVIHPYHS